jgi:holliday junction DNA helicase RuvA
MAANQGYLVYNRTTMIRLISGTIIDTTGNSLIVETSSGIGYLVAVTHRLLALPGESIRLYTHLAVRETALDLYGFVTPEELTLFELLLTISGIGPKSALQIMDQADRTLIVEAVAAEDPLHLTKLSSISKKTAEKLILGLKDKLDTTTITPTPVRGSHYQDAFDTLITLGYNPQSVRQVLDTIGEKDSTSVIVTEALRQLS